MPETTSRKGVRHRTWADYESEHEDKTVIEFRRVVDAVGSLVKERKWPLRQQLNKRHVVFKFRDWNRDVIRVRWDTRKRWTVRLRLPVGRAEGYSGRDWRYLKSDPWNDDESVFKPIDPSSASVKELADLVCEAYEYLAAQHPPPR